MYALEDLEKFENNIVLLQKILEESKKKKHGVYEHAIKVIGVMKL